MKKLCVRIADGPTAINITGYTGESEDGRGILNNILTCTATGYPVPTYLWIGPNDTIIAEGRTVVLAIIGSGLVYTCNASNNLGSASLSVNLTVTAQTQGG